MRRRATTTPKVLWISYSEYYSHLLGSSGEEELQAARRTPLISHPPNLLRNLPGGSDDNTKSIMDLILRILLPSPGLVWRGRTPGCTPHSVNQPSPKPPAKSAGRERRQHQKYYGSHTPNTTPISWARLERKNSRLHAALR